MPSILVLADDALSPTADGRLGVYIACIEGCGNVVRMAIDGVACPNCAKQLPERVDAALYDNVN